ncbi:MAG: sterol desaturase family protein [Bacteroidota bacterium]
MKTNWSIKITETLVNRINSVTWALTLLVPVLLIANTVSHRFLFHLFLFFEGWLAWTFNEYYMHRFVMHDGNQKKGLGRILNHSHHHKDPSDFIVSNKHRIIMICGSIALISLAIFLNNYFTLICGYVFGFTFYSCMHIMLHRKWSEKLFPHLHQFHIYHHCKHPDKCFGVTFTWWDHLFGTVPFHDTVITDRIKNFYYRHKKIASEYLTPEFIKQKILPMNFIGKTNDDACLNCCNKNCANSYSED